MTIIEKAIPGAWTSGSGVDFVPAGSCLRGSKINNKAITKKIIPLVNSKTDTGIPQLPKRIFPKYPPTTKDTRDNKTATVDTARNL
ncbi:hypothetical protein D3C87_1932010 [compost metagenome]